MTRWFKRTPIQTNFSGLIEQSKRLAEIHNDQACLLDASTVERIRTGVRDSQPLETWMPEAIAMVLLATRQTLGFELFDTQFHAGIVLSSGRIAEMQTGEGKTLAGILPAFLRGLLGQGVHVVTPNHYLARRDCETLTPVFRRLGMTTGCLSEDSANDSNRIAYQADITFGPAHAFGFDYLRDQTMRRSHPCSLFDRLQGDTPELKQIQRGLHSAIIDEADHVLIDDAISPLVLSQSEKAVADDVELYEAAHRVSSRLSTDIDFVVSAAQRSIELTDAGFSKVYAASHLGADAFALTDHRLRRPWHEYIIQALRAKYLIRRDVDYVIQDSRVKIIDVTTGRIYPDRTWSGGLHQAIEVSEGLEISSETHSIAQITRQRYFRQYGFLAGMTGTAGGCEDEFASVYGLDVKIIPLRIPSQRRLLQDRLTKNQSEKWSFIADEVSRIHLFGRPVLIGTTTITESQAIASELGKRGLVFELLNGVQDSDEAAIIARAGRSGAITVATNLAGRGTDIPLDDVARELGGLHVIVSGRNRLARVDRQLVGRCARCGDPGSAVHVLAADDEWFSLDLPWIRREIVRRSREGIESNSSFERQLGHYQAKEQRKQTTVRMKSLQAEARKG